MISALPFEKPCFYQPFSREMAVLQWPLGLAAAAIEKTNKQTIQSSPVENLHSNLKLIGIVQGSYLFFS